MADLNNKPTAQPNYALDQTIVFLRPKTKEAIAALNDPNNASYRVEVEPPEKPRDQLLGDSSSVLSGAKGQTEPRGQRLGNFSAATPQRPLEAALYPFAFRLGFDSVEPPSRDGFTFGSQSECTIQLPVRRGMYCFVIRYVLESGALMITANGRTEIGDKILKKGQSLLLMPNITLQYTQKLIFLVQFPDIGHCVESHKKNYQRYSASFGVEDARYLLTSRSEAFTIGAYQIMATLGQGGFGVVHLAVHTKTGASVAMKVISKGKLSNSKEVEIMPKLHHEHIIKYYACSSLSSGQFCILMELAVNDLDAHIQAKREKCLTLNGIRSIARQALSALAYLHGNSVTHRDLKPGNILVTKWDQATDTLTIKLGDFGFASHESRHYTWCGTDDYIAPEIKDGQLGEDDRLLSPYTTAADIWSMGKILDNLVRDSQTNSTYPRNKQRGNRGCNYQDQGPAKKIIEQMMLLDSTKRPTATQCLEFPCLRPEEVFSEPVAKKRKASPDSTDPPAKGPGPGPKPAVK